MISIIMGVYNNEKTLEEAILSLINQSYQDWELIVCNDCSTDSSYKILKDYSDKESRIKIINNPKNMGLAASLNNCLKNANGKYIARMDGDDISLPDRFKIQIDFLERNPEYDLVGTSMISFNETGDKHVIANKLKPQKIDLPKFNPFHHATIVMKKDVLCALNGYTVTKRTKRAEDVDLWFRFFEAGYKGINLKEALYRVREDEAAFKRRKLNYSFQASQVLYMGIRRLRLPLFYYIYVLKPIISYFTPLWIKKQYRMNLGNSK